MTDIPALIARVRELDAAATKGPWRSCDHAGWAHPFVSVVCERDRDVIAPDGRYPNDPEVIGRTCMTRGKIQDELANAALIAYYRTAAPQLAAECERLRACMAKAGLAAFMRDGSPEPVAEHLRSVIDSYEKPVAECERLRERVGELEASAAIVDAHVGKMHELDAIKHRVIVCALAGDMAPAKRYAEIEARAALKGSGHG